MFLRWERMLIKKITRLNMNSPKTKMILLKSPACFLLLPSLPSPSPIITPCSPNIVLFLLQVYKIQLTTRSRNSHQDFDRTQSVPQNAYV